MTIARIDANIILRYLTLEPPEQAEKVTRLFERLATGEVSVVVDEIVVAEVVWTLASYYRVPRKDIAEVMLNFIAVPGVECRSDEVVRRALVLFDDKNIDFADALLCARMLEEGEAGIYSFDRHFDRATGIRRIEPA